LFFYLADLMREFPTLDRGRLVSLASEASAQLSRPARWPDDHFRKPTVSALAVMARARRLALYAIYGTPAEQIDGKAFLVGNWIAVPQALLDEVVAGYPDISKGAIESELKAAFKRLERDLAAHGLRETDYGRGLQGQAIETLRGAIVAYAEKWRADRCAKQRVREEEARRLCAERHAAVGSANGASGDGDFPF
jgi:hypothetical protein